MDMSKDISLITSDIENSIITPDGVTTTKTGSLPHTIDLKLKLEKIEAENVLLRNTVDNLNSTINTQKKSLESSNNDIKSYCSVIQELQVKMADREIKIDDETIETLITNESKIIANNENIKNIIHNFKNTIQIRNNEITDLKSLLAKYNSDDKQYNIRVDELEQQVTKLENLAKENIEEITRLSKQNESLLRTEQDISDQVTYLQKENTDLKIKNEQYVLLKEENERLKSKNTECEEKEREITNKNNDLVAQVDQMSKQINALNDNLNSYQKSKSEYDEVVLVKDQQIESLKEDIKIFKNSIAEMEIKSREIVYKNIELVAQVEQLSEEINNLNKNIISEKEIQSQRDELVSEKDQLINSLRLENDKLKFTITEKETNEQEILNKNALLLAEFEQLKETYDKDNLSLIHSKTSQAHISELNLATNKIQSVLSSLTGKENKQQDTIENIEVIYTTLNDCVSSLEIAVCNVNSEKNMAVQSCSELKNEMTATIDKYKKDIETLHSEIEKLTCSKGDNDNGISQELSRLNSELDIKEKERFDLEQKYSIILEHNKKLAEDITNKSSRITLLIEKEVEMNTELVKLESMLKDKNNECEQSKNRLISFMEEITNLESIYKEKQDNFYKIMTEKDIEIQELTGSLTKMEETLKERFEQMVKQTQQASEHVKEKEELLKSILTGIESIVHICELDYNFDDCTSNLYSQIPSIINNVSNHIQSMKNTVADNNDIQLKREEKIIDSLNSNFGRELNDMSKKLEISSKIIESLKKDNMDLKNESLKNSELLKTIKTELQTKNADVDFLQTTVAKLKHDLNYLRISTTEKVEGLHAENVEIQKYRDECDRKIDIEEVEIKLNKSSRKSLSNIITDNPRTLNSICLSRILDLLPSDATSDSEVTTSTSNTDIKNPICDCEYNTKLVERLHELNSTLQLKIQDLYITNTKLIEEREDVRREIQSLIEPSIDLYKKVNNHRTTLATLTATTHAENKLLKSQVKALQHHHLRHHNVCKRDIPELKKQLLDLLSILKNDTSDHRYSLPNILDRTSNTSTLRHDLNLTLDSDLLMLDTNVSFNTTVDTLTAHEQTCLDTTHINTETEVDNNSTDKSINFDLLLNDNKKMMTKLEHFERENQKLKELLDTYKEVATELSSDNDKPNAVAVVTELCINCEHGEELKYIHDILNDKSKEVEELQNNLTELKKERVDLKEERDNLLIKISSITCKLNTFELECKNKTNEIEQLKKTLSKNMVELAQLQEENDNLSTEMIENISETDSLKKEVEELKVSNNQWSQKYAALESTISQKPEEATCIEIAPCANCAVKDELIESFKNKQIKVEDLETMMSNESTLICNKIRILKNELDASRQDCQKVTEEVTTIKNQIECSNISMNQGMELDESMSDLNMYSYSTQTNKDQQTLNSFERNLNLPMENTFDLYTIDKNSCLEYYLQITGVVKQNLTENLRIVDIMKLLYDNLVNKHGNEVENLINKLKDYEETVNELQSQITEISRKHTTVSQDLEMKQTIIKEFSRVVQKLKSNIDVINEKRRTDANTILINEFKENILHIFDKEFSLTVSSIFDHVIDIIVSKHQADLTENFDKFTILQDQLSNLTADLALVNENLKNTKAQLNEKDKEYNILLNQAEKTYQISNAVTMELVRKDNQLKNAIIKGCQDLMTLGIITPSIITTDLPVDEVLNKLFEFLKHIQTAKQVEELENQRDTLEREMESLKTTVEHKNKELDALKEYCENLQKINNAVTLDVAVKETELAKQKSINEKITKELETKLQDVNSQTDKIESLRNEMSSLKQTILKYEANISDLERHIEMSTSELSKKNEEKMKEMLHNIERLQDENNKLKHMNEIIDKEKINCALELEKVNLLLKDKEKQISMTITEVSNLQDSIKESTIKMETMQKQYEEMNNDCTRLQTNIKTHEKAAEIQNNMIKRYMLNIEKCFLNFTTTCESHHSHLMLSMRECYAGLINMQPLTHSLTHTSPYINIQVTLEEGC